MPAFQGFDAPACQRIGTFVFGVCGVAPAMMVDDELYGNLTKEKVIRVIADVRRSDAAS